MFSKQIQHKKDKVSHNFETISAQNKLICNLDDWKDQFMKEVNQKVSLIDMALREELINIKTVTCKYSGFFFTFGSYIRGPFSRFFFKYCSRKR